MFARDVVMSAKTFLTFGALLALGFGVPFLLTPSLVMHVYGIASTPDLTVAYRYFGVALLTVGLVIWPLRSCLDPTIVRPILVGHAAGDSVGVAVSAWAGISGATNGLAWLNVLIYAGLTAGAVYCYTAAPLRRTYTRARGT